jgi:hypothetical protein
VTVRCTVENSGSKVVSSVSFTHADQSGTLSMRLERGTRIAGFAHARLRRGSAELTVQGATPSRQGCGRSLSRTSAPPGSATTNIMMRLR